VKRRDFLKLMIASASIITLYRLGQAFSQSQNGLTPLSNWYVVQIGVTPTATNYILTVDGEVENPLQLTFDDLKKMPSVTISDTIQCVSDPYFLKRT
jgi:DMSO/TMAO reductase YedYZ molybdopterin-dependent catalytic subunit